MLRKIAQHIRVPERLLVAKGKFGNAVTPHMSKSRLGTVGDFPAAIREPAAEIHIFEPHRVKSFIEAADAFPRLAPHRQAGSGGLIDELRTRIIEIETPI